MSKKRILFSGEASFLNTGFSTIYHELLPRLAATGKYELAEIASYSRDDDPRIHSFIKNRWKFYGVMPMTQEEQVAFNDQKNQSPRCGGQNTWQFGEGKLPYVLADFKPDMVVCVPPGEVVMTMNGYKPIEEIKIGEEVLTHKGRFKRVIDTMRRYCKEDIYSVYFNGMAEPLRITSEHPVLVYKKRKQTNQKKSWKKIYDNIKPEFVPAKDLRKEDLVVLPSLGDEHIQFVDVSDHLSNYAIDGEYLKPIYRNNNYQHIKKEIEITPDFARLIGYIIGDGNISKSSVSIYFGLNERRFVDDVISIVNKIGLQSKVYEKDGDRNMIRVMVCSVLFAEFLSKWMGNKSVPYELWKSPANVREQLISGLVRSDGCYKKNTISYTSVDQHIAYNLRMLYASIGIPCTLVKRINVKTNYGISKVVYDVNINANYFVEKVHSFVNKYAIDKYITYDSDNFVRCPSSVQFVNDQIVSSIRNIDKAPYEGLVYNLEVEDDNSYVLQCTVHNCLRDFWMDEHVERSSFRNYFKWIWMPTVDSVPAKEEWVNTYRSVDLVLAYSDFGVDALTRYGGIKIYPKPMRPGVDPDVFKPRDKAVLKKDWLGCNNDVKVISVVARNQSRKLFPDAIDAFAIMKEKYKGELAIDKAVLLLHTSWPDNMYSYDYPRHVQRIHDGYYGLEYYSKNIRNSIFNTFLCYNCGFAFLNWAVCLYGKPVETRQTSAGNVSKIFCQCPKCNQNTAATPDTSVGFSREQLADFYGMSDLFLQVSIAEGCGLPVQEAKACGVPTLVTDYSATAEKGRFPSEYVHLRGKNPEEYTVNKGGDVIPVGRYYHEPETSCKRAHPDVNALAKLMHKYLVDDELREKTGIEARECAEENYDWGKLAEEWEYILDNIAPLDRKETWDKPHEIIAYDKEAVIPEGLSDDDFIDFLYINILKYSKVDPIGKVQWMGELGKGRPRDELINTFKSIRKQEIDSANSVNRFLCKKEGTQEEPEKKNSLGGEIL